MAKTLTKNYIEIPIEKLIKADWNYKMDNDELKEKLKKNIMRNGQIENIIVRELDTGYFEIVNGNHRFDALSELEFKKIVAYNLGEISLPHAQRIAVETNETRFATDNDKLSALLKEINLEFDIDDLRDTIPFDTEELSNLLDLDLSEAPQHFGDMNDDDFDTTPPERPKTVRGDLYVMNGHRLLCGDSTVEEDVSRLMDGKQAQLLFTDPPYNINYAEFNHNRAGGTGKDWTEEYCSEWKDSMTDEEYKKFLVDFLRNAKNNMIEWAHYYIWHATSYFREVLDALEQTHIPYDKVPIQWVKQVAPLSWVRYKRKSEPCIYAGKGAVNWIGEGARWFGPNNETNIWEISRDHNVDYVHPTQKPLALAARAIYNSSQEDEIVLDLFLGSGSTMIASDKLNRTCFGMEYEPKFCDVIVKRFMKYCSDNGKTADISLNGLAIDESHFELVE